MTREGFLTPLSRFIREETETKIRELLAPRRAWFMYAASLPDSPTWETEVASSACLGLNVFKLGKTARGGQDEVPKDDQNILSALQGSY